MSLEISSASFAYPVHDGSVRADLARALIGRRLESGFLLSTCLRVEVTVPGSDSALDEALEQLFGQIEVTSTPNIRHGEEAVAHLYRVAAGLESPIIGEQEILTQFRQSLIEAEEAGHVGGVFARLLESAVSVGRQARELLPGSPHNSMAAVAAQAVGSATRVAVLGSGIMATAAVDALTQLPAPPEVTVVARNPDKVAQRDDIEVLAFDRAVDVLGEFPAVVSATSAKRRLIDDETMSRAISGRTSPLLLIDMAMPPDFRPEPSDMITYLDIDDLARMADRRTRSDEADLMVSTAAAEAYRQYRDHHEIGPLIGGLMQIADDIVDRSVARFAGRLGQGDDEAVMRQAAHTVARTLLAGPVSYLKESERSPDAIDVIADAFGVDDE